MSNLNYFTVGLLMVIESSFIPFPSEAIIPFAAYKAAQGELNIFGVVIAGTMGALAGAYVNYFLSKYLGRAIVYSLADSKAGRILLLSKGKVIKAENYFLKYGKSSTFIGRLVPAVRQVISIPAGLANMNLRDFTIYTIAGAGIWNTILAVIGFYIYDLRDKIYPYLSHILIGIGLVFVIYLVAKSMLNKRSGTVS